MCRNEKNNGGRNRGKRFKHKHSDCRKIVKELENGGIEKENKRVQNNATAKGEKKKKKKRKLQKNLMQ